MNYDLNDLSKLTVLASTMSQLATELSMLNIYSDNKQAVEGRESELERLFSEIHGIMLGDMRGATEGVTEPAREGGVECRFMPSKYIRYDEMILDIGKCRADERLSSLVNRDDVHLKIVNGKQWDYEFIDEMEGAQ
ncbi:MAG: hypothetical protein R3183_06900 [Oleiphilaceae bacterium]|nr:hypothetical protein [Oleiphilaceae bacterium]